MKKDKIFHIALGLAYSIFFGFLATVAFAFLWEFNDKRHGCIADFGDILATSLGGLIGGALHLFLMYQCWGTIVIP